MSIPYLPPDVTVNEVTSPSVNTALSTTNTVCVIGLSQGYELETQQLLIPSGTAPFQVITLASGEQFAPVGAGQFFVSVVNQVNPSVGSAPNQGGYAQGPDFTVTVNATNNVATVTPVSLAALSAGGTINFTYQVIPVNYFQAQLLGSQAAIEQLYGPAYAAGGVQTPLSAGAASVITGGQVPLVVQPLFVLSNPSDPTSQRLQPTLAQAAAASTWQQTLYALRSVQGINYIVPIAGQSAPNMSDAAMLSIEEAVQDHLNYMENNANPNEYIFGIFGEDNTTSSSYATDATLQSHATTLATRYSNALSQNMVLLVPASFGIQNPSTNQTALLNVGGQYAAATYAGFIASSAVTGALTRQTLANLVQVNSYRDDVIKNADAQAGLTVLQQNQQTVQIRHAITLDNTSVENRELSVVRSKFFMMSSIIDVLNNQIIGTIPADGNATTVVTLALTTILDQLQQAGALVAYSNVQARLLANDPTTCEIRFSWQPAFPLNYINVVFSLDLTGATGTSTSTTTVTS